MTNLLRDGQSCQTLLVRHLCRTETGQELRCLSFASASCPHQGCSTFSVRLGRVSLFPKQQLHHWCKPSLGRKHQGCLAAMRLRAARVGTSLQEDLARLQATLHGGHHQHAHAILVHSAATDAMFKTLRNHRDIAFLSSLEKRRDHVLVETNEPQVTAWCVNLCCQLCRHPECNTKVRCTLLHRCICIFLAKVVGDLSLRLKFLRLLLCPRKHGRHLPGKQGLHTLLRGVRKHHHVALILWRAARDDHGLLEHLAACLHLFEEADAHRYVSRVPVTLRRLSLLLAGGRLHVVRHAAACHHPQ
mmetsp:Transcript_4422/g.12952  ORF Transcript_4422/g.12952 Transcript_4422/m.12952 type:complete len:302 (+) Transcript_4422:318-1223(+)